MMESDASSHIVDSILLSYQKVGGINDLEGTNLPSKAAIESILNSLKQVLFPGFYDAELPTENNIVQITRDKVDQIGADLSKEIYKSINWQTTFSKEHASRQFCMKKAEEMAWALMRCLPNLREQLVGDAHAIFMGDPAAKNEPEVMLSYPGFLAITVYRIAHFLYTNGVPFIPRMMTELAHAETGIDIHPGAKIGLRFCIDHGTGVVIGETAEIGNDVKLYQGVTLGALSVSDRHAASKRHPTLKNNVTVYAKTTILGGDTIIGNHCIVGGNVWLTHSLPDNAKVYLSEDLEQVLKIDHVIS